MPRYSCVRLALCGLLIVPRPNAAAQAVAVSRVDTLTVMIQAAQLATDRFSQHAHRRFAASRGKYSVITDSLARVIAPTLGAQFGTHSELRCSAQGCADDVEMMSIDAPIIEGDTVAVNVSIAKRSNSKLFPEERYGLQYLFVRRGQHWVFVGTGVVTYD